MNKNNATYNPGTKFEVCNHEELVDKGWVLQKSFSGASNKISPTKLYEHPDFKKGGVITYTMIEKNKGQTLTVLAASINFLYWYYVKENANLWPVATFMDEDISSTILVWCPDSCVEGQTPILGWFICKICGHNLRKIK